MQGSALGRQGHQTMVLLHQVIRGLDDLRVQGYAVHRADLDTLGSVKMPYTLGAFMGINFINFLPKINGLIGTLGFTDIAIDALTGDHQGHESTRPTCAG